MALQNKAIDGVSRRREGAGAILIDNFGRFLLQQRDDCPGILQPGKVGLFGGHRESNETYLQCLLREINEEIGYFIPQERFEYLANYEGADPETPGGVVRAEFFVARDIIVESLVVTEGSLVIIKADELTAIEPKFTPAARFAMKALLSNQRRR